MGRLPGPGGRLLHLLLPPSVAETVIADLLEEYETWVRPRRGVLAARLWLWRQILSLLVSYAFQRMRGGEGRRPRIAAAGSGGDLPFDMRQALRGLLRRPAFSSVVVLTLAVGIGANTAIFSIMRGVVLATLPYDHPERIVQVLGYHRDEGFEASRGTISYLDFLDLREQGTAFEEMAAYDEWDPVLRGPEHATRIGGASVTDAFFDVLGVRVARGRSFAAEEASSPGTPEVVVTHGFWQQYLGADPAAVGTRVSLNDRSYEVIGILPAGFEDPGLSGHSFAVPQVWRPTPSYFQTGMSRDGRSLTAVARMRPGVTLRAAQTQMDGIMDRLAATYPEEDARQAVRLVPIRDRIIGPVRPALLALSIGVLLVLLVACLNVASLLTARYTDRSREFDVRRSLGATPRRILRLTGLEALLLALLGGSAGMGLARAGLPMILSLAGDSLPRAGRVGLHTGVLVYALLLVGVTTAFLYMAALLHLRRGAGGRGERSMGSRTTAGKEGRRLQNILIGTEAALTVVLLSAAAMLVSSQLALLGEPTGMRTGQVATVSAELPSADYPDSMRVIGFYDRLFERLQAMPGTEAVASINILPMGGSFDGRGFRIAGRPDPAPGVRQSAQFRAVVGDYFGALGVPILQGRGLDPFEHEDGMPGMVINRTMARTWWPDADPLGARIRLMGIEWKVVGVAGDVRQFGLSEEPAPAMYVSDGSPDLTYFRRSMNLVVRSSAARRGLPAAVRAVVWEIDPSIPVVHAAMMEDVVVRTASATRFRGVLSLLFAGMALLIGAVGLYGMVSHGVARRQREMGIRLSLGAAPSGLSRLVIRQGMAPVLIGLAAGLAAAPAAGSLLGSLLYGVGVLEPLPYLYGAAVLTCSALVACAVPAIRAARVDPVDVLRAE